MHAQPLLATAAAVVGLYAGGFHAWVFALHRRALEHAWVAIAAAGACLCSAGTALLHVAATSTDVLRGQQVQGCGSPLVMLGAVLFTLEYFDRRAPRLRRAAIGYATTLLLLVLAAPELLLERPGDVATAHHFELTALGALSLAGLFVFFPVPLMVSLQAMRERQPGAAPLVASFTLWTFAGVLDTASGTGFLALPLVMPNGGYIGITLALSAILLRDLTRAMHESERRSDALQAEARERDDALRAIDLRLARGEQLAAIGTLAAGVAHEINNPLAYVSANLNQLRALVDDDSDPDEAKEILGECREGLARVGWIVTDLLRMGHHGESEREPCDLGEIVHALLPLLVREAGEAIELVADVQTPLPLTGHPRLLRQAALNVALNAVHAVREPIPGRPARIALSAFAERGHAVLCVRDNGPGIPAALRAQIFEAPFTTKREGSGSGLGLALTRLVVRRHGGAIEIDSDADGTALTIRLPLRGGTP